MKPLPHQLLWEVRQVCKDHPTLYYIDVQDEKRDRKTGNKTLVPAYVLYRRDGHSRRGMRICKTRSEKTLLAKVRTAAGLDAQGNKPAGGNEARR